MPLAMPQPDSEPRPPLMPVLPPERPPLGHELPPAAPRNPPAALAPQRGS